MDEMDEYRDRIERRYSGRRQKNDRRQNEKQGRTPRFIEPEIVVALAALVAFGIALYHGQ